MNDNNNFKIKPKAKIIKMHIQKNEPIVYKIYRIFTMNTRLSLKILSPLQFFIIQSEPSGFFYVHLPIFSPTYTDIC